LLFNKRINVVSLPFVQEVEMSSCAISKATEQFTMTNLSGGYYGGVGIYICVLNNTHFHSYDLLCGNGFISWCNSL
jgi:hypothetical protein